ncbi:MAG: AzlD domain-containing protein [Pseudomonadota bacterium]
MTEPWIVILYLAAATFAIRLTGVYVGQSLPQQGRIARALNALPGCLIAALVAQSLSTGGPAEWTAATVAAATAIATRSLPLTMAAGIAAVLVARAALG